MTAKKQLRKTTTAQTAKVNPDVGDDSVEEEDLQTQIADDQTGSDTSDGGGDDVDTVDTEDDEDDEIVSEHIPGAPRDGRAFRAGEPVILKGVQRGGFLVVQEPVYRAVQAPGSSRWRFHLLVARHAEVSLQKVKEIGEREDAKAPGMFKADQKHFTN